MIVTGGNGFIGKAILQKYSGIDFSLSNGFDIRDYHSLYEQINEGDVVFHLAAVSKFDQAENNPYNTLDTNVCGSFNVLRACIEKKARKLVVASSGSVYIPVEYVPIDERHPIVLNKNNIYGSSKFLMEQILNCYVASDLEIVVLRLAHVYGKGKTWGGVYNIINSIKNNIKPTIYGGKQTSDFVHVDDVVNAFQRASRYNQSKPIEFFNIGTGIETNILDAVKIIEDKLDKKVGYKLEGSRTVDATRFYYDMSEARNKLGFESKIEFERGIELTIGD